MPQRRCSRPDRCPNSPRRRWQRPERGRPRAREPRGVDVSRSNQPPSLGLFGPAQDVQLSVAGLDVAVAAPPVAVTPVNEGIEKYVLSHAAGADAAMVASFVRVTTSGLSACPLPPTVRGVVRVCVLPLDPVAKLQVTPLGVDARQPL